MLIGSVLIALIATFLPLYVDLDPETAMIMRIVFCAGAVVNLGQAFWIKAKLTRQLPPEEQRKTGSTVQRNDAQLPDIARAGGRAMIAHDHFGQLSQRYSRLSRRLVPGGAGGRRGRGRESL
jgi:hypothetical protein